MTVTRSFRETVQARATNDPHYRYGLLTESMDAVSYTHLTLPTILLV